MCTRSVFAKNKCKKETNVQSIVVFSCEGTETWGKIGSERVQVTYTMALYLDSGRCILNESFDGAITDSTTTNITCRIPPTSNSSQRFYILNRYTGDVEIHSENIHTLPVGNLICKKRSQLI